MALVVVAASAAPVSSLLISGNSSIPRPRGSSGSVAIQAGSVGRSGIGGRLAVERNPFLGERVGNGESLVSELGLGRDARAHERRSGRRAECYAGLYGRGGGGGRVFFMPFGGPGRGGGGAGGSGGTFARSEWERRQCAQQERIREMLEREITARSDKTRSRGSYEFALLRELEKRLRFEEEGNRKGEGGADGEKNDQQQQQSSAAGVETEGTGAEGATAGLGASTYELMKELEKRLRAERESQRAGAEESSPRERRGRETGRTEREGRAVKMGEYSSLYDYVREWDREMREQRAKLEELWRSREGGRVHERRERNQEERARGHRGRHEEESGSRRKTATAPEVADEEKKEEVLVVGEEEESKDSTTAASASVGPEFADSNATVVYLKNEANGAEIYLVGTSHVSQRSVDEVREVIEKVKPDFVMVELCRKRYEGMKRYADQKGSPMAFVEQMLGMLTNGNIGVVGKLMGIGLSSFYRLLSYRGFHPGREFQTAIEEGKRVGAKIVLGDQDIDTTLKQMGKFNLNMSVQDTFQFFGQRMPDDIASTIGGKYASDEEMFEKMRDRKVVRRFNEKMEQGAPSIYKALVSERNEVMVKALRNLKGKVVAVVGLAHMDGMEKLWQQANEKYLSGQSDGTVE